MLVSYNSIFINNFSKNFEHFSNLQHTVGNAQVFNIGVQKIKSYELILRQVLTETYKVTGFI